MDAATRKTHETLDFYNNWFQEKLSDYNLYHQDEEEVSTGTGTRSNSDAESNRIKGMQKHFDERLNRAIGGL